MSGFHKSEGTIILGNPKRHDRGNPNDEIVCRGNEPNFLGTRSDATLRNDINCPTRLLLFPIYTDLPHISLLSLSLSLRKPLSQVFLRITGSLSIAEKSLTVNRSSRNSIIFQLASHFNLSTRPMTSDSPIEETRTRTTSLLGLDYPSSSDDENPLGLDYPSSPDEETQVNPTSPLPPVVSSPISIDDQIVPDLVRNVSPPPRQPGPPFREYFQIQYDEAVIDEFREAQALQQRPPITEQRPLSPRLVRRATDASRRMWYREARGLPTTVEEDPNIWMNYFPPRFAFKRQFPTPQQQRIHAPAPPPIQLFSQVYDSDSVSGSDSDSDSEMRNTLSALERQDGAGPSRPRRRRR